MQKDLYYEILYMLYKSNIIIAIIIIIIVITLVWCRYYVCLRFLHELKQVIDIK